MLPNTSAQNRRKRAPWAGYLALFVIVGICVALSLIVLDGMVGRILVQLLPPPVVHPFLAEAQPNNICIMRAVGPRPSLNETGLIANATPLPQESCNPLCWRDLTPGVSTEAQAVATLSDAPFVASLSVSNRDAYHVMRWDNPNSGTNTTGQITAEAATGIIRDIAVYPEFEIAAQEFIDTYGQPDHFFLHNLTDWGPPDCYAITLLWIQRGLVVETVSVPSWTRVSPEVGIGAIMIAVPTSNLADYYLYAGASYEYFSSAVQSWQGFDAIVLP